MPPWVQAGGREAWIARLKDPAIRARVAAEMRDPAPKWENLYRHAGAEGTLLVGFKTDVLKPLTGRTLAEVAKARGVSPEEAAIDLVIADGTRVQVVYFLMSEENVRRQTALPWMSFGSDAAALAPEGVFLKSSTHPRAYGNFARLLGKYVREEKALTLQDAIRRLTSFPAANLGLRERGALKAGYFADVVVFDPATITDVATYDKPHRLATGVSDVLVNGGLALRGGAPTGAATGRVVRGRGWTGWPDGGCRASAAAWTW
jgi:N-acyl-D-amino-acid deacylase